MTTSRKHHFVSQFYLAGFTSDGTQDGEIYSFDVQTKKSWKTVTRQIGVERDFNAIATEDGVSDALEKQLSTFEAQAAATFTRIRESRAVPTGDDFTNLVNFMALIGVRRPSMRKQLDSVQSQVMRIALELYLETPERWKHFCEKAKQDGATTFVDVSYEQARDLFLKDDWRILSHPGNFHSMEFDVIDTVIQLLAQRDWSILIAPRDSCFVTSDQPVNLIWTLPGEKPPYGPGYGSKHSSVLFPISKDLCLVGKFDAESVSAETNLLFVATANSVVMTHCMRFVYSPVPNFACMAEDMTIASSDHYFNKLR
jgi:hypothetical protein